VYSYSRDVTMVKIYPYSWLTMEWHMHVPHHTSVLASRVPQPHLGMAERFDIDVGVTDFQGCFVSLEMCFSARYARTRRTLLKSHHGRHALAYSICPNETNHKISPKWRDHTALT